MRTTTYGFPAVLLLILAVSPGAAQVALTPAALGMGGAYDGVARGQETIFLNPALLGLPGTPSWSVAFPQITAGGTLLGTRFSDVERMTRYRRVSPEQRDEILGRIPPEGTEARYDLRAPLAAVHVGRFALGASYTSAGRHALARDLMELFFDGYEVGRTDYRVSDTHGSRATLWDVAGAYGHSMGPLSIGATAHYYRGGTLVRSRLLEPRYAADQRDLVVEYRTVLTRGGNGYGLDLGAAYQPSPALTLSGSVSNVISRMTWSEDLRTRHLTLTRDDIENVSATDLLTRYESSESAEGADGVPLADLAVAEGLFERSGLPSVLRLGAAWSSSQGTELGVSYRDELADSQLGEVWSRSLGVGVQQRIPYVTLRAGYSTSLDGGSMTAGGLSLGVMQLGVARLHDGDIDGFERTGWIGTFGIAVRTTGSIR